MKNCNSINCCNNHFIEVTNYGLSTMKFSITYEDINGKVSYEESSKFSPVQCRRLCFPCNIIKVTVSIFIQYISSFWETIFREDYCYPCSMLFFFFGSKESYKLYRKCDNKEICVKCGSLDKGNCNSNCGNKVANTPCVKPCCCSNSKVSALNQCANSCNNKVSCVNPSPCSCTNNVSCVKSSPCSCNNKVSCVNPSPCSCTNNVSCVKSSPCSCNNKVSCVNPSPCSCNNKVSCVNPSPCSCNNKVSCANPSPCSCNNTSCYSPCFTNICCINNKKNLNDICYYPDPDPNFKSFIRLYDYALFVTSFSIDYDYQGQRLTQYSGRFSLGFSRQIDLPPEARNLKVSFNLVDIVGEKTFSTLELFAVDQLCFAVYGITIDPYVYLVQCGDTANH